MAALNESLTEAPAEKGADINTFPHTQREPSYTQTNTLGRRKLGWGEPEAEDRELYGGNIFHSPALTNITTHLSDAHALGPDPRITAMQLHRGP